MSEVKYIAHYGITGQEWYKRRFQNPDGSLTPLGRARYGVGEARKKAGEAIKAAPKKAGAAVKAAPKKISRAVKKTASDLKRDNREASAAAKKRRAQVKQERFEAKMRRRQEKAERLARKMIDRESKTTLRELKEGLEESKIEAARKKVEALTAKQDRIKELAELKEQQKQLKSSMKDVKKQAIKDAHKKLSKNDIRYLTDEQLAARIERLKQEKTLAELEFDRATPTWLAKMGEATLNAATDTVKTVGKEALAKVGKKWLGLDEIAPDTPKTRAQKLQDTLSEMRAKKDLDDFVSSLATASADAELAREATRLQNQVSIAASKKKLSGKEEVSEKDTTSTYTRQLTERKEMERRANAYRDAKDAEGKPEFTISEIAKRMGISESEVKDLLYTK